jgi:hypothetical protein
MVGADVDGWLGQMRTDAYDRLGRMVEAVFNEWLGSIRADGWGS